MTAIIEVNCAQPLPEFEWETAQYDAYVFGVDVVESISTEDKLRKIDVRRRRFSHSPERRRPRHPNPEASYGRVREAAVKPGFFLWVITEATALLEALREGIARICLADLVSTAL